MFEKVEAQGRDQSVGFEIESTPMRAANASNRCTSRHVRKRRRRSTTDWTEHEDARTE
jgi:hypothetical protein